MHVHIKPQDGVVIRRNWAHHLTVKSFRFDRANTADAPWGVNGTAVENVAFNAGSACFKGDRHTIGNNTVFGLPHRSGEQGARLDAALVVMMYDPAVPQHAVRIQRRPAAPLATAGPSDGV